MSDGDERRQQHEPQRNAIHAEVVINVEALNPRRFFDKLHLRRACLKAGVQRQRDQKAQDRPGQREPAHQRSLAIAPQRQDDKAKDDGCPDGNPFADIFNISALSRQLLYSYILAKY